MNANTGDTFVSFFLDVNLAVGIGPTGDFFSFFLCAIGIPTAVFFFFLSVLVNGAVEWSVLACWVGAVTVVVRDGR